MNASFMLQEYIEESNGEDIRAIVVGNKVVAAMKRIGEMGEFRSNIHRGGTGEIADITEKEIKIALRAAKYLGIPVAGVDMIRSKKGPLLIEVNASPGLQGVEAYTKVNIAEHIIKFLETNVRQKFQKRTRRN